MKDLGVHPGGELRGHCELLHLDMKAWGRQFILHRLLFSLFCLKNDPVCNGCLVNGLEHLTVSELAETILQITCIFGAV